MVSFKRAPNWVTNLSINGYDFAQSIIISYPNLSLVNIINASIRLVNTLKLIVTWNLALIPQL